jgi:hypothetical protein
MNAACFMLVSYFIYSSVLKMEATCSPKTLVYFQWTTQNYTPEENFVYNNYCENLKLGYYFGICPEGVRNDMNTSVRIPAVE